MKVKIVFAWLGALALDLALIVWQAYVASILWGWFVVGAFGAPILGMGPIYGLMMTVRMFAAAPTPRGAKDKEDPSETIGRTLGYHGVLPALWLAIGWALH